MAAELQVGHHCSYDYSCKTCSAEEEAKRKEKSVPHISVDDRLLTSVSLEPISSKNHEASRSTRGQGPDERRKTEGLPEGQASDEIKAVEGISADCTTNTGIDPMLLSSPRYLSFSSAPGLP